MRSTLCDRPYLGAARLLNKSGRVMINTGLTSTVVGCMVGVERDEVHRIGRVVVDIPDGVQLTDVQRAAINQTAKLLGERAKRFLGIKWTIVPWDGVA